MGRFDSAEIVFNNSSEYSEMFRRKKLKFIKQYSTFDFKDLKYFKDSSLEKVIHIVKPFEKIYNISYQYYKSPEYGWLICYTNNISNELEIKIGQELNIYFPLENILRLL